MLNKIGRRTILGILIAGLFISGRSSPDNSSSPAHMRLTMPQSWRMTAGSANRRHP